MKAKPQNRRSADDGVMMEKSCETRAKRRPWGASTKSVIDAIQAGSTNLRAIANTTGISYRSVNAIVYSLEMQHRVEAECYFSKRGDQTFKVVSSEKRSAESRQNTEHPRHIGRIGTTSLQSFFGMNHLSMPSSQGICGVRVHRLV